jgi:translation initiation factor eIF-2B subunit delta
MDRRRDAVWRDLGLEALVNGEGHGAAPVAGVSGAGAASAGAGSGAAVHGSGGAAAGMPVVRVRQAGRRMGGRRVVGLR